MNEPTLKELVEAAGKGSEAAFSHLFDTLYEQLYRYAHRRTSDHHVSEDIVSNSFLCLIEQLPKFKWVNEEAFYGWVYRITYNEVCSYFRKLHKYKIRVEYFDQDDLESLDYQESPDDFGDRYDDELRLTNLRNSLHTLKEKDRKLVELYYFAGAKHAEIASACNMSEEASRVRLHRAVNKLKQSMTSLTKEEELA